MFGERRNLILPVIFDIANIVRNMSPKKPSDFATTNEARKGRARRSAPVADDGKKSYHERKFNMTNFSGTREVNDQQAIESTSISR